MRYGQVDLAHAVVLYMKRCAITLDTYSYDILLIGLARWNRGAMLQEVWRKRSAMSPPCSPRVLARMGRYCRLIGDDNPIIQ